MFLLAEISLHARTWCHLFRLFRHDVLSLWSLSWIYPACLSTYVDGAYECEGLLCDSPALPHNPRMSTRVDNHMDLRYCPTTSYCVCPLMRRGTQDNGTCGASPVIVAYMSFKALAARCVQAACTVQSDPSLFRSSS